MPRPINIETRAERALDSLSIDQAVALRDRVQERVEDMLVARILELEAEIEAAEHRRRELSSARGELERRLSETLAAIHEEREVKVGLEREIAELRARLAVHAPTEVEGALQLVPEQSPATLPMEPSPGASPVEHLPEAATDGSASEQAVSATNGTPSDLLISGTDGDVYEFRPKTITEESARAVESRIAERVEVLEAMQAQNAALAEISAKLEHELHRTSLELRLECEERAALEHMAAALRKEVGAEGLPEAA